MEVEVAAAARARLSPPVACNRAVAVDDQRRHRATVTRIHRMVTGTVTRSRHGAALACARGSDVTRAGFCRGWSYSSFVTAPSL